MDKRWEVGINKKKIRAALNEVIESSLWCGPSDAGLRELSTAMACYLVLKELGLDLRKSNKKEILKCLSGENVDEIDLLNDPMYNKL